MYKKIISVLLALSCLCVIPVQVNAMDDGLDYSTVEPEEIIESVGLINSYLLSCWTGTKKIHIKMETIGEYTMDEIGFTDIQIQRYTSSGWYTEKSISSVTTTNASGYYLSDYTTSVLGGYSYRVVLNHYAKDGSTTERVGDTSNSVWIS